ncbi:MAG: hypothetical protein K6T92_06000 [Candidatus Rokubacteria bacterium]|nr:hypothetical protein [Candidatus Rokubacteria bacterium]
MKQDLRVADAIEADERERVLIEAAVMLARTLRDERDRLAERLREVEHTLATLAARLDTRRPETPATSAVE